VTLPSTRFAALPAGVVEADQSVTHPRGFRAAGIHAGVKKKYRDLGLLHSERPCVSAAVFTTNAAAAAPVRLTRGSSHCDRLRAVVVNSGNANACTGKGGLGDAAQMRRVAADALALQPEEVAVASTGIIGVPLPIAKIAVGIDKAAKRLAASGGPDFAAAIRTTDRTAKEGAFTLELPAGEVRVGLAAKGAGMISPAMATMLCFLTTDATFPPAAVGDLLRRVVDATFNRVTVDGQQSTNDTVLLLANGASGIEVAGPDLEVFEEALRAALLGLAVALVADGEGSTKTVRLRVEGAWDEPEAERVARAVADSPLVKAAFFGGDPNWGRVMQATGQVIDGAGGAGLRAEVAYEGISVVRQGEGVDLARGERRRLRDAMQGSEIDVLLALQRGECTATVYFSDLTYDYVTVNSEYN
jgi:glutamate N-acetyltransferase/amino-acid N-acetyltransferase